MEFVKLSEEEFGKFSRLIHEMSGIYLKESKITLLSNRLRKRIREKNFNNFDDYYSYVSGQRDLDEVVEMLNAVSTNETYFFRNTKHFEALFDVLIPEMLMKNKGPITIWCAGCSTGEEPYTIAMLAAEKGYLDSRYLRIDATDLNTKVLEDAKVGIFDEKKMRATDKYYIEKYFKKIDSENYEINGSLKEIIRFYRSNLIYDRPAVKYDIIFCRNVMIYFDKDNQKKVIDMFYDSLNCGGHLFIGHSESLYFIENNFKYKKVADSPVYYKD